MAVGTDIRSCNVVLHDDTTSNEAVLCGTDILPPGAVACLAATGAKALCFENRAAAPNTGDISVHLSLAKLFGFENRMKATVHIIDDVEAATATHVEILLREQHLSRADMWKMRDHIDGSVLYRTQKLNYLGPATASIEAIYVAGREVHSAFVSHPRTKLIFRSASARFTILIQISKEVLENWAGPDLMYERVTTGFLPELFNRWDRMKVRHQITIVLFGRGESLPKMEEPGNAADAGRPSDFYHVVALDAASSTWPLLLRELKVAFNKLQFPSQVSLAAKGNMVEAIRLAATDFSRTHIDQHLASTGTSIIAITAGSGLFCADYDKLKSMTELLVGTSIGVDIVSVAPKPLHPVPLFQYDISGSPEYALPHWADISFWSSGHGSFNSCWIIPAANDDIIGVKILPLNRSEVPIDSTSKTENFDAFDKFTFGASSTTPAIEHEAGGSTRRLPVEDVQRKPSGHRKHPSLSSTSSQEPVPEAAQAKGLGDVQPFQAASPLRRPILQSSSRKISVGPRGLAPTQSIASTGLSTQHAQQGKDVTAVQSFAVNEVRSGLSKQIKESLRRQPSYQSIASSTGPEISTTAQPLSIQVANKPSTENIRDPASLVEEAMLESVVQSKDDSSESTPTAATARSGDLSGAKSVDQRYPMDSMFPWLTLTNPCNPRKENMRIAGEYRQWQNVFPRIVGSDEFKWDSICHPAALPLLKELHASLNELERFYSKKIRRLVANVVGETQTAQQAMAQMISMRLNAGFQVVSSQKHPYEETSLNHAERILLSLGAHYQEVRKLSGSEIQVTEYEKRWISQDDPDDASALENHVEYQAEIKALIARKARPVSLTWACQQDTPDWSGIDDQCMNGTEFADLGVCRVRFVLIPADTLRSEKQGFSGTKELSDEEHRLEGIQKLTQMWQRHRFFTDEDQRHQASMVKPKSSGAVERDPNPLAVEYQTRDTSAVVGAYGLNLTKPGEGDGLTKLFSESEQYHSSNFDVAKLAKQMQAPPPHGVEFKDRRWFTRLHLKCFRGDEMINWLLRVFKDLQTRQDAVALGNQLLDREIFAHVRGKHEFRDGNYFYQIKAAHRITDYPDTAGFFGRPVGRSLPSTPIPDFKQSPAARPTPIESGAPTPTLGPVERKEILLSQRLQYNVDAGRKSSQVEIVNVHYDRIHNPENCYNIRLDWNSTTTKLIRESVARWAALAESHGLRLVQLPIDEACKLGKHHPFEQTISVSLAVHPPDRAILTPHLDSQSSSPRTKEDPEGFHKAILRKLDFVLDTESARCFPQTVAVSFSWGKPDYEYTQFVHKSGLLLAQITNDDRRDFLLLPNRLASNLATGTARRVETPSMESIVQGVVSFCRNDEALHSLYEELGKGKVSAPSPFANASLADQDIEPMELPPKLTHRALLRNAG